MKQEKTISLTVEQYDVDWPPTDASGALAWFQAKLEDIPAEFRGGAKIEFDSTRRYDSSYATIEFSYVRPETDDEEAQREQQAAAHAARRRSDELRTLAALQAKYGAPAREVKRAEAPMPFALRSNAVLGLCSEA